MSLLELPSAPDWSGWFWLLATLGLYVFFVHLRRHFNNTDWAQPLLWTAGLLVLALLVFEVPLTAYQSGGNWLLVLLFLSTAAIGVPIYDNMQIIRRAARPFLLAMAIGSISAVASALLVGKMLGFDQLLQATVATKSITSPIAMSVAEEIGGMPVLAAGIVIISGNVGVLLAPTLFALLAVDDPRAQGLALGVAAHGIGTVEAMRQSALIGSFAGLAMGLNGVLTSLVLPILFL